MLRLLLINVLLDLYEHAILFAELMQILTGFLDFDFNSKILILIALVTVEGRLFAVQSVIILSLSSSSGVRVILII